MEAWKRRIQILKRNKNFFRGQQYDDFIDITEIFHNRDKFLKEIKKAKSIRKVSCCLCCKRESYEVQLKKMEERKHEKEKILSDISTAKAHWQPANIGYAFILSEDYELIDELLQANPMRDRWFRSGEKHIDLDPFELNKSDKQTSKVLPKSASPDKVKNKTPNKRV